MKLFHIIILILIFSISFLICEGLTDAKAVFSTNVTLANSTISSIGDSSITIPANEAIVSFSIETTNKTLNSALKTNNEKTNLLYNALNFTNEINKISIQSFDIFTNYNYGYNNTNPSNIKGFTITRTFEILLTNMTDIPNLLDNLANSGISKIDAISFVVNKEKIKEIETNLIVQSIKDAHRKAAIAASAEGLKVIGVKHLNLHDSIIDRTSGNINSNTTYNERYPKSVTPYLGNTLDYQIVVKADAEFYIG